jgi:hypothetical protein
MSPFLSKRETTITVYHIASLDNATMDYSTGVTIKPNSNPKKVSRREETPINEMFSSEARDRNRNRLHTFYILG